MSQPEWDRAAVTRMLGRKRYLDDLGPHGQLLSEALSPESDPANPNASIRYEVEGPFADHAQQALDAYEKKFYDSQPKDRPRGADRFRVRKKE